MSDAGIATAVCALTFVFAFLGMLFQKLLPESHMSGGSRDMIGAVMGLVALLLALVLGTLVGSAYGFFAVQKANIETLGARAIQLDLALDQYGAETDPIRKGLRASIEGARRAIWANDGAAGSALNDDSYLQGLKMLNASVGALSPKTPQQTALIGAINLNASVIASTRLLMALQLASPISWPLLTIVVSWAMLLFFGYGVLSRLNSTSVAAAFIGAFAVGSAVFLILELNAPFTGLFRIPEASVQQTIASLKSLEAPN